MSNMSTHTNWAGRAHPAKGVGTHTDQRGAINVLLPPLIILFLFFVAAVGFGFWAFSERQDYKENSDKKVAIAVVQAQKDTQAADAKQYAEEAKKPYDTYIGPSAFGAINLKYPKTWSAYVVESGDSGNPVDGFFHPNFVPSTNTQNNAFALRVQVTSQSYDNVLQQYSGRVDAKQMTVQPYSLPKVPSIVGSRLEGQITEEKQGVMIVLPLRNMTLKVWTESNNFKADFDNIILPNFTFQP